MSLFLSQFHIIIRHEIYTLKNLTLSAQLKANNFLYIYSFMPNETVVMKQ